MKDDQWKMNMDFILCVIVFVPSKSLLQEMEKKKKQFPVYFKEQYMC